MAKYSWQNRNRSPNGGHPYIIAAVHNLSVCTDDPNTNCTQLAKLLDICSDVPHAKTVCRKYCGLCPLGKTRRQVDLIIEILIA